ncbi:hypothetical protein KK083_19235 [Fulvivirgaceae bacterium PWU4]|uniref:Uncharacterized protein n=1 Tax=Chryseosolibacter histidini TaxID=2782349 RepID=A0AAP2GQZ2_9BACT|nr:hypothetical protein [Chryseosolibacter histidini]MBT1699037.1 hypothetical protein [Chryseosolibacter histidini]
MHNKIIDAYPFLEQIPPDLLDTLDLNSLYIPTEQERSTLSELSALLKNPVVIYKKHYTAHGAHLCRTIRSAELTHDQLDALRACEAKLAANDKVLVAYCDPVEITVS